MDVKKFVDVSSFFLFEASGDSEAAGLHVVGYSDDDDDDDDAESSCCSDVGESSMEGKIFGAVEKFVFRGEDDDDNEEDDENGEVVEQEEAQEFRKRRRRDDHHQRMGLAVEKKSTGSDDSRMTKEREKSKVFWESCLAS